MQDDIKQWFEDVDTYAAQLAAPYREAVSQSDKDALEIAKLLIQSLILLHGGALVTLPTLYGQIGHKTLVDLIFWLSVGLSSALFAGVSAFFALTAKYDANLKLLDAAQHVAYAKAAQVRAIMQSNPKFEEAQVRYEKTASSLTEQAELPARRFNVLRALGIFLVLASLLALMRASYVAANQI